MLQEAGRIVNETQNFFDFASILRNSGVSGLVAKFPCSQ
jgi:hypothetical protein